MTEVSLFRLYALRAGYLLMRVPETLTTSFPEILITLR
jgi:hypothetical protein